MNRSDMLNMFDNDHASAVDVIDHIERIIAKIKDLMEAPELEGLAEAKEMINQLSTDLY